MESLPVSGCDHTAPSWHLTDPFWGTAFDSQSCRVPGAWQGLTHAATLAREFSLSFSIQESEVRGSSPWDTGASRVTTHPHLLPHVPTSAVTPGSLAAFPGLSSSGCSAGTQRCNPDHGHCWDRAAPQPSTARPQGAHGVSTHSQGRILLDTLLPPGPVEPEAAPHLRVLGVLLQQQGQDAVGDAVVGAEGGTCCCLQEFGTGPHQLHVGLAQMVPAI